MSIKILIAEDDIDVAESLSRFLTLLGHGVVGTALSGQEALRMAAELRPDLCLMDMDLGGEIDGVEAAEQIRSGFGVPFVYLTGQGQDVLPERAKSADPYGSVAMPVSLPELRMAVDMALCRHEADKRVQESEERYRSLFGNMLGGFAFCRMLFEDDKPIDFVYLDVNEAFEELTGLRNVVGKRVTELIPGIREANPELFDIYGRVAKSGLPEKFETYLDALGIWLSVSVYSTKSEHFVALFDNITSRKRAVERLRASEEKYRASFNTAAVGMDLVDIHGRFIDVNETLSKFLGYTPQELQGLSVLDVTHPADVAKSAESHDALLCGTIDSYRMEKRYLRKDGATVWADISVSAIRGPNGEHQATVGVIVDITKRKISDAIRVRLATAVEQAAETIVITDTLGTILYVNPAFERTTGYVREEAVGVNPRILKSGRHDEMFYKSMWETITSGRVWSGHFVNKRKDGALFEEEATISPIHDESGAVVSYVGVKRDVTREVSLQKQLLQAQKMEAIGTLAGGIAHDFNNLLQVVLGYSELLLSEKFEGDPEREDLHKIHLAARSGADLVQRLLTFSRKVEPKCVPLGLNDQIKHVERLLSRTIPKMIDIRLKLEEDIFRVSADPALVEQVVMNLAVNARDAMPDGGVLTIRTENATLDDAFCALHPEAKPGAYVMLSVSDSGEGMDQETIEHMFEPFYTTREMGRGTGLGLAMVYGIVKQHGGHLTCDSKISHGTVFNIFFPALENEVEPEVKQGDVAPCFGTETILVVDDEEPVRDFGARILAKAGYTVLIATNGKEALHEFNKEKSRISLVILDLIMPEMGGKECLQKLLEIDPNVRVLFASGYSSDALMAEPTDMGARGFITKPFRVQELLYQVRRILDEC